MIQLTKIAIPQALENLIKQRTQRYLHLVAAGEVVPDSLASSYSTPEIKMLLKTETSHKCAYCESKITHVYFGDVEHIIPKSVSPELRYSYANLTFACAVCNNKKGAYNDLLNQLLNPFTDQLDQHIRAVGPMVIRKPQSDRGLITQKLLDLNRLSLIERRTERLESISSLLDQIERTNNNAVKMVLEEQIRQECANDKEFSFVVREFVGYRP